MSKSPIISSSYQEALGYAGHPADVIDIIANASETLVLGKQLPGERPVLFVPGFTEGFVAEAPFIADLASRDLKVIMADQYKGKVIRNGAGKKDVTFTQGMHNSSNLIREGIGPVNVVTHSYGSLIFQSMLDNAAESFGDESPFNGATVVMLAPGCSNDHESLVRLGARFGVSMITEGKTQKDFPDIDGEMMKAGTGNFMSNPIRTVREIWDLAHARVDYPALLRSNIASLAVLGYAKDRVYPHSVLESTMQRAMQTEAPTADFSYATPISLKMFNGEIRSGTDASHNDQQFNPSRVGAAVAQILRNN